MNRIVIITDTREQTPWSFDEHLVCNVVGTLKTADYALEGDTVFGIERKSLDDFVGTISTGWERFLREIQRMHDWDAKVIIVESDYYNCCHWLNNAGQLVDPTHRHYMITPQFIMKRIAELTLMNVSVLFSGNAQLSSGLAYTIFKQRAEQLEKDKNDTTAS